jgi:alkylhydroperoxidase family enzyme
MPSGAESRNVASWRGVRSGRVADARKLGETERRIYLLSAWREADLHTEQERAALALTDAMTRLPETQDVPDEVYAEGYLPRG